MRTKQPEPLSNRTIAILIVAVLVVVFIMVGFVLSKSKDKPQSPQAMVAAALRGDLGVREWQPGMGPQPFMYHPAAQNQLAWQPLPGSSANQASSGVMALQNQAPQTGAQGWYPLNTAPAGPQSGIRAYRGPVQ